MARADGDQGGGRRKALPRVPGGISIGGSGLPGRIAVAVPAAIIAILCIVSNTEIFAVLALVLGVVALHEFYGMADHVNPVRLAGFLTVLAFIAAGAWGDQFQVLGVVVFAFPVAFLLALFAPRHENQTLGLAATLFGAFWIGIPVAHALLLHRLPHGDMVIIDVLLGTFIGDTFAYAGGRMFGRRKLAPALSPNKTQEGLVIGIIGATATVWFAGLYQDWITGQNAILLGLAVAAAAPLGDLFESYIKRDFGVKDTGRAFGAHGGALDRVDAALFTLVVGYYVWYGMAAL